MLKFTLKLAGVIGLTAALAAPVFADEIPKKSPVGRYAKLWSDSPFTEKPPPPEAGPTVSELDDYTLAGVSPVEGGYSVILINKKKRDDRIHLMPGMANEQGFTVVSVRQDPISTKNTTVEIKMANGKVDRVGKEEKFLALKAVPAAARKPAAKPAAKPGSPIPGGIPAAKPSSGGPKQPRVRRVPTPPKK